MKTFIKRLVKGDDLKSAIQKIASEEEMTAGCILNAVGSLSEMRLRTDATNGIEIIKDFGKVEIVSLIGTIGEYGKHVHLHLSGADKEANVFGGHLVEGCVVHTTVELMILDFDEYRFLSEVDPLTGFKELSVKNNS